jgi:hypothetical protein
MALSPTDQKPKGISVADAYTAIRRWYQSNVTVTEARGDDYGRDSAKLIRVLPPASTLSDVEQRAVLREVIVGYLEWGYHQSDDQYKMAAYAHAAFDTSGTSYSLSPAENESLKASQLWPYFSPHVKR